MLQSLLKYFLISFSVILFATACEKLEIPNNGQKNEEENTPVDSTDRVNTDDMYSVADIINKKYNDVDNIYVIGYIVGYVNGTSMKSSEFSAGNSATNIILADTPVETDYSNCIPVQLSLSPLACKEVRDAINLLTNPSMLKKKIYIQGNIDSYMRVVGIKETKEYKILTDDFDYDAYYKSLEDSTEVTPDNKETDDDNIQNNDSIGENKDSIAYLYNYIDSHGINEKTAFSVEDALTKIPAFLKEVDAKGLGDGYIKGYIVGFINGGSSMKNAVFNYGDISSNIIIADSPKETDTEKCIAIQLTNSSTNTQYAKESLNLVNHPENLGKEVIILGSIEPYMGKIGVKNARGCLFVE